MTDRIDPKAIADELRRQASPSAIQRDLFARAADTIDSLASQLADADRQFTALKESSGKSYARAVELAAVVEKVRGVIGAEIGWESPAILIDRIQWALSTAPTDALAEHDARLIEGLADEMEGGFNRETLNLERRQIKRWLRERARLIREGGKP